ncbi:uncharacterized protein METZ01_LOCUS208144, partial [marine metagenome]
NGRGRFWWYRGINSMDSCHGGYPRPCNSTRLCKVLFLALCLGMGCVAKGFV